MWQGPKIQPTRGSWMFVVGVLASAVSGCASETGAGESEAAIGAAEKTPFDEQYVDFSLSFTSPETIFSSYYDDCATTVSFDEPKGARAALGSVSFNEYGNESLRKGKIDGSLVLPRSALTRDIVPTLALACRHRDTYREYGVLVRLAPVRIADTSAGQTFSLAATGGDAVGGDAVRKGLKFSLSARVTHSRPATTLLTNCGAFSMQPESSVQRVFLSATSHYEGHGADVTSTLHVDGGKLKSERVLKEGRTATIPIAFCRAKGPGEPGIPFEAFGSKGSLEKNEAFPNAARSEDPPLAAGPMTTGEERTVRHVVPGSQADVYTTLKVY